MIRLKISEDNLVILDIWFVIIPQPNPSVFNKGLQWYRNFLPAVFKECYLLASKKVIDPSEHFQLN